MDFPNYPAFPCFTLLNSCCGLNYTYTKRIYRYIRVCEGLQKEKFAIVKKNSKKSDPLGICLRIAKVRRKHAGPRGKVLFAKHLELSPSTYSYYEKGRVPPAEVLVRIAEVGGVDLHWLLTGRSGRGGVPADNPVLQRAAKLLGECPHAAGPLAAFVDILAESMEKFPPRAPDGRAETGKTHDRPEVDQTGQRAWIPVLGRSAAGVPQFWSDRDDTAGLTTLGELISRHAQRSVRQVRSADAAGEPAVEDGTVQVIALSSPQEDVVEFVSAPGIKARYPDAFAVRIDGESMSPEIRHGDLAILSPSVEADDGKPAVVQLQKQIGVTCKIFRREGRTVHLVPINETFAPSSVPRDRVVWALRILARVRT